MSTIADKITNHPLLAKLQANPVVGRLFRPGPIRTFSGFLTAGILLFLVAPVVLSQFRLELLGKYLAFAIVASGIGLAWGRGGLLTLGQGIFFGMGAYAMAMFLKLSQTPAGQLPDFMQLYGEVDKLPGYWVPFQYAWFAIPMIVILPAFVAYLLGSMIFRRGVRGAYFAILSQALAAALAIFIVGQPGTTGGTNGITNLKNFFGYSLDDPANRRMVYFIIAGVLLGVVAITRQLMYSRYGELLVATRDAYQRVRFLGYNPARVLTAAFSVSAAMAGLGGAAFVSIVGAINPASIDVVPSIAFIIGVAVGGRSTLLGPVLGAIGVAWFGTAASEAYPDSWQYIQGGMFILVVAFLPGGLATLPMAFRAIKGKWDDRKPPEIPSMGSGAVQEASA